MAGAITYAASRPIDEITAGSILLSRGGSIPVSAKEAGRIALHPGGDQQGLENRAGTPTQLGEPLVDGKF